MGYGIVDCNNFFASCERVFRPDWEGRPLVVLSNNDGCVVARSNEAKALGIAMGVPLFKVRDIVRKNKVVVRSGNFRLYGDLSNRVMGMVARHVEEMAVYSIDEAFVSMPDDVARALGDAEVMRDDILKCVGLPVSVGIGPSRVLAKLATHVAKKGGMKVAFVGTDAASFAQVEKMPVSEVWGVGRRLTMALMARGIMTVGQLRAVEPRAMRQRFSVVGERLVWGLRGLECGAGVQGSGFGLCEELGRARQSIVCSRGFGRAVVRLEELEEAAATHAVSAARKLRGDGTASAMLVAMVRTNPHGSEPYLKKTHVVGLAEATQDSRVLAEAARRAVRVMFEPGRKYQKCGVMLTEIVPAERVTGTLFGEGDDAQSRALMGAMDALALRFGRGTVRLGSEGMCRGWGAKSAYCSPCYTTDWDALPKVGDVTRPASGGLGWRSR